MNRTLIALIFVISSVIGLVAIGAFEPKISGAGLGPTQPSSGCTACHAKLSAQVPEEHFKATLNEVKYCLACHSVEGAASAFAWTAHQNHYAQSPFAGTCWSCHQLDAAGNFKLIGVEGGKQIKATQAMVDKMQPYYLSWTTSEHLDHKHGQRSVTCVACHGTSFPESSVKKEKCFTCHGSYEQIAEQAPIHYDAIYPHFLIESVECNDCHKAHEKSVLVCNQCHDFDYQVP